MIVIQFLSLPSFLASSGYIKQQISSIELYFCCSCKVLGSYCSSDLFDLPKMCEMLHHFVLLYQNQQHSLVHGQGLSGCCPFFWKLFCTIDAIFCISQTSSIFGQYYILGGYEELAVGFEPITHQFLVIFHYILLDSQTFTIIPQGKVHEAIPTKCLKKFGEKDLSFYWCKNF